MEPRNASDTKLTAAASGGSIPNSNVYRWACGGSSANVVGVLPGSCSVNFSTPPSGTFLP